MKNAWTYIILIIAIVLAAILQPHGLQFGLFDIGSAFRILSILFVIALFQERALDVFLTLWRAPKSEELTRALTKLKSKKTVDEEAVHAAEKARADFKVQTRNIAMRSGFVMGFIIAMVGIRALEPMVDISRFQNLPELQQTFFRVVDVIITGGLLAGGSDGIHKITEMLRAYQNSSK